MEFGGSTLLTLLKAMAALAPFLFQNIPVNTGISPGGDSIAIVEDFEGPYGLAVIEDGTLFVADAPRGHVVRFSSVLERLGTLGTSDPKEFPHAITKDMQGNLLVPDHRNGWVKRYSPKGLLLDFFPPNGDIDLDGPVHVHVQRTGTIFITDYHAHRVLKFSPEGAFEGWIGERSDGKSTNGWTMTGKPRASATPGGFHQPHMTTTDNDGNLYVVDTGNHRVQKFSSAGVFLGWTGMQQSGRPANDWLRVGSAESSSALGGFHRPTAVTLANSGTKLVVTDTENNRIVRLELDGVSSGWLGEDETGAVTQTWKTNGVARKGSQPGAFMSPFFAQLFQGDLYVADTGNKRVQVIPLR